MYHLNDLKSFIKIVESGGVIAASQQLHVAPATLSHRVGKLEQLFGTSLFFRSNKGMTLSPEGQSLYDRLRPIVDALEELQDSVEGRDKKLGGKLRITVPPWVLNQYFLPRLSDFRELNPGLQLEFIATDMQRDISYEGIDVAIRVGQLAESQLLARKLAHDERILCASPQYLEQHHEIHNPDDLNSHHSVCLPWLRQWQLQDKHAQRTTIKNPQCTLVSTAESVTEALKQGMGIGIKSRLAVVNCIESGELVEVLPGALIDAQAPIWFVRPNSRLGSKKVETFYEFCRSAFSAIFAATD